jgi:predicted DsbA family dithiol-disulfide isomerase
VNGVIEMKQELEVFFDYACPYCLRAHEYLTELMPQYPDVSIVWRPCEAHPRPDRYGPHSDLCIQGYFFALENGVDVLAYHARMYRAALKDRIDIENIDVLTDSVRDLVDADAFRLALQQGTYQKALAESNQLAFERSGVWVVPAYRMEGRKIDSVENIGVSKEQLRRFLDQANG